MKRKLRHAVLAPGQSIGLATSTWLRTLSTVAALVVGIVFSFDPPMSDGLTMMFAADAAVVVLGAGCIWLSAQRPTAALVSVAALCAAAPIGSASTAALELVTVVVVLQAVLATDIDWRTCAAISVLSLGVNDIAMRTSQQLSWWGSGLLYPWILTALAIGLGLQGRRLHSAVIELRRLRDVDRDLARIDERRRIARDLHDVAAHHLTALVVRNKLAQRQATFASLEHAATFTATTAGEALDALRQVVGVLTAPDPSLRATHSTETPRPPQPTIADLPAIIERCSTGGLNIQSDIAIDGELRRDVEIAIVRLVQESLSNVLNHRGPGDANVSITTTSNTVHVTVTNPTNRASFSTAKRRTVGLGLVAMRERVESCGGTLAIGQNHATWTVSAAFPADPNT